jgi:phenylpropionate dioxygenase-like ring-hydroxylating dioxygenase large terminal subunit
MLLGEQLIAFRDTSGKVGLVQNLCPHRGASLFYGRNEENGIRCVYHGWKFDTEGNCVDMPNEPAESNFKSRIKATAYPTEERKGIVWAYMGPRDTPPAFPGYEALDMPDGTWEVGAAMRSCNWLQAMEGDLDTTHAGFLHSGSVKPEDLTPGTIEYYRVLNRSPRFVSMDTDYGAVYGASRPAGPGELYWRIAQFLFPCGTHIPGDRSTSVMHRMWVPMDDHHVMFYAIFPMPENPDPDLPGFRRMSGDGRLTPHEPENTTDWFGRFRLKGVESNDYLIDREAQRSNASYTGIPGVFGQDQAVTESMGPILDRTIEHVGTTDMMIIRVRHRLMDAAHALVEHKITPPGVDDPEVFRSRPASTILPEDADWIEATEEERAPEFFRQG